MKSGLAALTLAVAVVPSLAYGQGEPPPPPPPMGGGGPTGPAGPGATAPAQAGQVWLGGALELTGAGSVSGSDGMGGTASIDLDSAFGVMGTFDYQVNEMITLRAMPRYITNIKPSGDTGGDSASAFDLRGGGTVGKEVSPGTRLYGIGALGYAQVSFPSSGGSSIPDATGLTVSVGGGASYAMNPKLRLVVELVYELGFESVSANGASADFKVNWLEFAGGIQFALGQ